MSLPVRRSLFIINFITGISDGLMLPFAACIIAIPFFAIRPWQTVFAGIILAVTGAFVFGLARFFGEKEEIHHHHPQLADAEAAQELALMKAIGIDPELTEDMKAQMEAERTLWLKEIQENELGWEDYDPARARTSGLHTAAGFLAGGLLVSFFFGLAAELLHSPIGAALATLGLFYFFGWNKGKLVGKNAARTALLQLSLGLVVALAAFLIATLAGQLAGPIEHGIIINRTKEPL